MPGPHVRKATPSGNGAHIPVPKDWLGQEVAAFQADSIALLVPNKGISQNAPGIGIDGAPAAYTGYFENSHGEQLIFRCPYKTPQPAIWHSDCDWAPLSIMQAGKKLFAVGNDGREVTLNPQEWQWIGLCLAAAGIQDYELLPEWEDGTKPSTRLARAILDGDRRTQIEVLEELLHQLRSERD